MRVEGDNVLTYSINFESWAQLETEVALSGTQTPIVVQQPQTRLYCRTTHLLLKKDCHGM